MTASLIGLVLLAACEAREEPRGVVEQERAESASAAPAPVSAAAVERRAENVDADSSGSAPILPEPPAPTPLEELLRLPETIVEEHRKLEPRRMPSEDPESGALSEEERAAARVRLEAEARRRAAGFDPKRERTLQEAEAGVAVDVDENTSVKGGVRSEREDEEDWDKPVPTVGIEKRF